MTRARLLLITLSNKDAAIALQKLVASRVSINLFQEVDDFMGRVTMPEYDHCLEAVALEPGGEVPASLESTRRLD